MSSVLPSPGTPSKQAVAADEQTSQDAMYDFVMANNDSSDLLTQVRCITILKFASACCCISSPTFIVFTFRVTFIPADRSHRQAAYATEGH